MSNLTTRSRSAVALDRLLAEAHLADAQPVVLAVVERIRAQVDKGQLSRYRRGERLPRRKTRKILEKLTAKLHTSRQVTLAGWDEEALSHTHTFDVAHNHKRRTRRAA